MQYPHLYSIAYRMLRVRPNQENFLTTLFYTCLLYAYDDSFPAGKANHFWIGPGLDIPPFKDHDYLFCRIAGK